MALAQLLREARSPVEETQNLISQLEDCYIKKHWFEYQTALEALVFTRKEFDASTLLQGTLRELQATLDPTAVIEMLDEYIDSRSLVPADAWALIGSLQSDYSKMPIALIFLRLIALKQRLKAGEMELFVADIAASEKEVAQLRNCPTAIYACLYALKCDYLWMKGDYGLFCQNVLRYTAYADPRKTSTQRMVDLAERCISAALVSDELLNFSDIVKSDVFGFLQRHSAKHFLTEVASLFNAGDIEGLTGYIQAHQSEVTSSFIGPHIAKITKNVRVIAVCDHVFLSPQSFSHQSFAFRDIAAIARIPLNEVEGLLIYLLTTGLMKGKIEQVGEVFHVFSVKPRALDRGRIGQLREKFEAWGANVQQISDFVASC